MKSLSLSDESFLVDVDAFQKLFSKTLHSLLCYLFYKLPSVISNLELVDQISDLSVSSFDGSEL